MNGFYTTELRFSLRYQVCRFISLSWRSPSLSVRLHALQLLYTASRCIFLNLKYTAGKTTTVQHCDASEVHIPVFLGSISDTHLAAQSRTTEGRVWRQFTLIPSVRPIYCIHVYGGERQGAVCQSAHNMHGGNYIWLNVHQQYGIATCKLYTSSRTRSISIQFTEWLTLAIVSWSVPDVSSSPLEDCGYI